jgi:CRISPR-associated protein Csx10
MTKLSVNLEAISPLAVREDHAASRSGGAKYIPGNTLLGSLATVHRVFRPEQKDEFERLFLRDETLYSNLYPATFETQDEALHTSLQENRPVHPLPKTAQSCKRHKGFKPIQGQDSDGHGVRDSLADWAIFELGKDHPSFDRLAALHKYRECKTCKERLDHFEGYYRYLTDPSERMVQAKNSSRLQTHTGIDRDSGTVREGILYNREVFDEGSKFWGEIHLPNDEQLTHSFLSFLHEINNKDTNTHFLRLGTGRTRGMGKVDIHVTPINFAHDSYTNFEQRVKALDCFIHDRFRDAWKEQPYKDKFFFALTLHSPAILTDDLLRYRTRIDADVLSELLDIDKDMYGLQDRYTHTSTKRITGWQELWGTPRINEYALDTGSVFLFQCNEDMHTKLIDKLLNLEEQGIGKRRAEGFGRICISDPFHTKGEQQ